MPTGLLRRVPYLHRPLGAPENVLSPLQAASLDDTKRDGRKVCSLRIAITAPVSSFRTSRYLFGIATRSFSPTRAVATNSIGIIASTDSGALRSVQTPLRAISSQTSVVQIRQQQFDCARLDSRNFTDSSRLSDNNCLAMRRRGRCTSKPKSESRDLAPAAPGRRAGARRHRADSVRGADRREPARQSAPALARVRAGRAARR